MSLKRKIVLLFLGLAVVPMLIVATFSFFYAAWLAEGITRTRLADTAVRASNELDAASLRVEQSLALLQQLPALQEALEGSVDGETTLEPLVAAAPFVTVRNRTGAVLASRGGQPDSPVRCDKTGGSRLVTIRAALSGSMSAEAGVWAGDLLPTDLRGPMRAVRVIDGKDGSIQLLRSDGTEILRFLCRNAGIQKPAAVGFGLDGSVHVFDQATSGWYMLQ